MSILPYIISGSYRHKARLLDLFPNIQQSKPLHLKLKKGCTFPLKLQQPIHPRVRSSRNITITIMTIIIGFPGFSTAKYTWLPVNSNHWYLNLAFQKVCLRSHYQTYKKLIQLRSAPTIAHGDLTMLTPSDWILIFTR